MITGPQLKAALSFAGWSRRILSEKTGINERTIQRAAEAPGVPSVNAQTVATFQAAFESAGIQFLENGDVAAGSGVALISKADTDQQR